MNTSYQPNAMTGRSTQPREAQRESGRCELSWTNCGSSPRAVNQTAYPVWSTRPERTCQVGFNVSSTLQEHSISVLTKCRARLWIQVVPRKHFRPGQTSPGRFLLYSELWELLYSVLSRISAAPFCPLNWPTHSSEIYLFCVHLQESCISWCLEICVVQKNLTVWAQRVWDFSERF